MIYLLSVVVTGVVWGIAVHLIGLSVQQVQQAPGMALFGVIGAVVYGSINWASRRK
jgi:hypothetical protein